MSAEPQSPANPIESLLASPAWRELNLTRCRTLADLLATEKPSVRFATGLAIRVNGYQDINPQLLIYDVSGGTLGIVQSISSDPAMIDSAIDAAVSVRQIFLEIADAESRKHRKQVLALQVELALVLDNQTKLDTVRDTLSSLARETGYLRLVGLSVLEAGALSPSALRRAFPWLLSATRAWFPPPFPDDQEGVWRKQTESFTLKLEDYRLRGKCSLTCQADTNLHLLHGHNGSGKSTFTEALELLATGKIERIEESGVRQYFATVRHRRRYSPEEDQTVVPKVSFFAGDSTSPKKSVSVDRGYAPEQVTFQAKSFRLDSAFMEKLARATPENRALLFLDAFTPGRSSAKQTVERERKAIHQDLKALPALASLYPDDDAVTVARLAAEAPVLNGHSDSLERILLPLTSDEQHLLTRIYAPLQTAITNFRAATTATALDSALTALDAAWNSVLVTLPNDRKALQTTLSIFEEFNTWTATGQSQRGSAFEDDLNHWLELQALIDLNSKYLDLVSTMADAATLGWERTSEELALLPAAPVADLPDRLRARSASLTTDLNEARGRLDAWLRQPSAALPNGSSVTSGTSPEPVRSWLLETEKAALNHAATWIEAVNPISEPLGDCVARALDQDTAVTFGKSTLGVPHGLDLAIAGILALLSALDKATLPGLGQASNTLTELRKLSGRAVLLQKETKIMSENLFNQLVENTGEEHLLVNAFNELLALFTPARWNYQDLRLKASTGDQTSLTLETEDNGPADLLLNTAELNAWTLTMFLLLAWRLPNPMRILVLDDPLQNMDELSVVTLARGLARLMPIFPKGWLILGFFHGEQNVEMISRENDCHLYQLLWLQSRVARDIELKKLSPPVPTSPAELQTLQPSWFESLPPLAAVAS